MGATPRVTMAADGFSFSKIIQGFWRLASWQMTPAHRLGFIEQLLELGITTVDHADIYGDYCCETLFGEALKLAPSVRDKLEIVTKCDIKLVSGHAPSHKINHYDTSEQHIIDSVENSLTRLGTDHIDVLLIHRPDCLMDADEVAQAFYKLKQAGKVKYFGVSNFSASQFSLLQSRLDAPLITNQVEINPLNVDVAHDGTLDLMQQLRIKPMAWSCLAGGDIFHSNTAQAQRVRECIDQIALELGVSPEQVIYAFVMRLPSMPLPIVGSGHIARVAAAVDALAVTLSREQWYRIWVASKGHSVP